MEPVTTLPRRPLVVEDLEAMPDDGHHYELVDGALLVTPAPVLLHQLVQSRLMALLLGSCPEHLRVLCAPTDVVLADDTVVQPDLLVARRDDLDGARLTARPLLVVEVLSPSTRHVDLDLKRARYERAAIAAYWVVDPDELSLRAWELRDGAYVETAHLTDGTWTSSAPYAVTVEPARLAD